MNVSVLISLAGNLSTVETELLDVAYECKHCVLVHDNTQLVTAPFYAGRCLKEVIFVLCFSEEKSLLRSAPFIFPRTGLHGARSEVQGDLLTAQASLAGLLPRAAKRKEELSAVMPCPGLFFFFFFNGSVIYNFLFVSFPQNVKVMQVHRINWLKGQRERSNSDELLFFLFALPCPYEKGLVTS